MPRATRRSHTCRTPSATPPGGAFVLPLGSHALLLYKGEYNWNDNDFGLFVWGALNSDNNAGELHYKELG